MTALQKVNLGTAPTGTDGDTVRTANVKANANVDVLNTQATLSSSSPNAVRDLAAADMGKRINFTPTAASSSHFPAANTTGADQVVAVHNLSPTYDITMAVAAGSGDTVPTIVVVKPGELLTWETDGVSVWRTIGRKKAFDETVQGKLTVGGTLSVTGASTLSGNSSVGGTMSVAGATTLSSSLTLAATGRAVLGTFNGNSADLFFANKTANSSTFVNAAPNGTGNLGGWLGWSNDLTRWAGVYFDSASGSGAFAVANTEWRAVQNSTVKARIATDGSYYYGYAASNGLSNANLVAGNVGTGTNGFGISPDGAYLAIMNTANAGNLYLSKGPAAANSQFVQFSNSGTAIGSIMAQSGFTGVVYNTTSDYRLKDGLEPMTGALASVRAAKLYTGYFKADASKTRQDMILAHEIAELVPAAVTGEKDAVEFVPVYRDGYDPQNIGPEDVVSVSEVMAPQQVDHSRLVLRLWGAVQELAGNLDVALERITALEAVR